MANSRCGTVTLVVVLLASTGCSSRTDRPETAEVTGTVTLDGQPLANVLVVFGPEEGRSSFGYTDEEGRYRLVYLPPNDYGAKIGRHKVSITTPVEDESDPAYANFVDPIPARYNSRTELTAEVKAGEENVIDFPLKSK